MNWRPSTNSSARSAALGVFWAVELVEDQATREPVDAAASWAASRPERWPVGCCPFLADNRVHVVPPCVVTPDEAATGLGLLTEVLAEVA